MPAFDLRCACPRSFDRAAQHRSPSQAQPLRDRPWSLQLVSCEYDDGEDVGWYENPTIENPPFEDAIADEDELREDRELEDDEESEMGDDRPSLEDASIYRLEMTDGGIAPYVETQPPGDSIAVPRHLQTPTEMLWES